MSSVVHVKLDELYAGGEHATPQDVLVGRDVVGLANLVQLVQETARIKGTCTIQSMERSNIELYMRSLV